MGNILTKRTAVLVGLSMVAIGMAMKYARANPTSQVGSIVKSIGLV
jgi:hypothetical protein